jgi:CubicO group peptidase (beta-lactamase class C family)
VLPPALVEQMTTNQLDPNGPGIGGDGSVGWGFGVDVQVRPGTGARPVGSYGWVGGLGTAWLNDPSSRTVAVVLTNQALVSPEPPPVMGDFWAAVFS